MADATLRATAHSSGDAAGATFSRGAATTNNVKTYVLRGQLVAQPYATGARRRPADSIFGKVSTILNPPNADRSSTYSRQHNATAVTVQTAGTVHKTPVPYHADAPRNRVKSEPKPPVRPFKSTLSFDMGPHNRSLHPFRTVSGVTLAPSMVPMHERLGSTNAEVSKEVAVTLHKRVFAP